VACLICCGGCLGHASGSTSAEGSARTTLQIQIFSVGNRRDTSLLTYSLGCSPPAGTKPDPAAACAALRDYVAHIDELPAYTCGCLAPRIGDRYAVITGSLDGKRVRLTLDTCRCGLTKRLVDDLEVASGLRELRL
jgi:hypothetical protein